MKTVIAALLTAIAVSNDSKTATVDATPDKPAALEDKTTKFDIPAFTNDKVTMRGIWGEVFDTEAGD